MFRFPWPKTAFPSVHGVARREPRRAPCRPVRAKPHVEFLEDRTLLSANLPNVNTQRAGANPSNLVVSNGRLFFTASDADHGEELWTTDGTAAGTHLVKDINPGPPGSHPTGLTDVNGTLFFEATDKTAGDELWKSDGTAGGTVMVKHFDANSFGNLNHPCGPSTPTTLNPDSMTNVDGKLFFTKFNRGDGRLELWRSDGTNDGTVMLHDYPSFQSFHGLTAVGGTLFFITAVADPTSPLLLARALWKSDGTAAGTVLVAFIDSSPSPQLVNVGGTLFFVENAELWKSDGTPTGTMMVKHIDPSALANVNGALYFGADHGLWKSDGTAAGTVLVKDIFSDSVSSDVGELAAVGRTLFFTAYDAPHQDTLWKSDGTAAGTVRVRGIPPRPLSGSYNMAAVNGTLVFTAGNGVQNYELWKSDGTAAGTAAVKTFSVNGSLLWSSAAFNGKLYFAADDGVHSTQLWSSDGTANGTAIVKELYAGDSGCGNPFIALGLSNGRVQVRKSADNSVVLDFAPYGPGYTGPVSVAMGDVNGDGYADLVTGAVVGNPDVRVYSGKDIANGTFDAGGSLLAHWFAYGLNFNVGANVAVGDVENNGYADIVTGATAGNPDVHVYRGRDIAKATFDPAGGSLLAQWFAYGLQFNVGANVAVGDVNGDGYADVVTGTTAGNPDVRVYSGRAIAQGGFDPNGSGLLAQWFAYGLQFNVGVNVAVGDTTGSGYGDVVTGATAGNPHVKVFSGRAIAAGIFHAGDPGQDVLEQFFAYDLQFNVGARVAAVSLTGDGRADILTGASAGSPHFRAVSGRSSADIKPPALNGLEGLPPDVAGGVYVGA